MGTQKCRTAVFPPKIALRLKKVCHKVSLYENYQRQSCKAFIGKNNWWGRPLLPEISGQTDRLGAKSPILDLFSSVAPPFDTQMLKSFQLQGALPS